MIDNDDVCLRQINPAWLQNGVAGSLAFFPFRGKSELSAYHGGLIDAEGSYNHFIQKNKSAGVQGISKAECLEQGLEVEHDEKDFKEHVSIDFSAQQPQSWRAIGKRLKVCALKRGGWLFQPSLP